MAVKTDSKLNWYPVRVFYGRAEALKKSLDEGNIEYFYPMHLVEKETNAGLKYVEEPLVRSLIFIKSTLKALLDLKTRYNSSLIPYYEKVDEGYSRASRGISSGSAMTAS